MKYVFDTSPFVSLFKNFYPSTFVTLWQNFDTLIDAGDIASTREVYREIEGQEDELRAWAKDHRALFTTPTPQEGEFVSRIYSVRHFQANIEKQKLLKGGTNADAFVIAKAAVVTLETSTNNNYRRIRIILERHVLSRVPIPKLVAYCHAPGYVKYFAMSPHAHLKPDVRARARHLLGAVQTQLDGLCPSAKIPRQGCKTIVLGPCS